MRLPGCKHSGSTDGRESFLGVVLSLPTFLWTFLLIVYPILLTVWLAFHDQQMVEANPPFAGFRHFAYWLTSTRFWATTYRTLVWTGLNLLLTVPSGIAIALLLNQDVPGIRALRTWVLLPWTFPIVVTTLMWKWILEPSVGLANDLLLRAGIIDAPLLFLAGKDSAMLVVSAVNAWRWTPFMAIVTLAGLAAIPRDLYEAAAVDGAGRWTTFWKVELPQLRGLLVATTFMFMMQVLNMFPPVWLLTGGGPGDATLILPVEVYVQAFQEFWLSRSAALAILLLGVALALAVTFSLATKHWREEAA